MTRWTRVLAVGFGLAALAGCAGPSRPTPATGAGPTTPTTKTFLIGRSIVDPPDMTISASEAVGFQSTADQPLQVQFVQPAAQAGKINCRVADPKLLERGQAPWAEFHAGYQGRLTADVPPGQFPSICTFAPGYYMFTVKVMDLARPMDEKLGRQGTITVR